MSLDGARRSIESQRDEKLSEIDTNKSVEKQKMKNEATKQITQVETQTSMRMADLENQASTISAQMSGLKARLNELPPNHPAKSKIESQLAKLEKFKNMIKAQIEALKLKARSYKQNIKFSVEMRIRMLDMRFANAKSLLLRQFAEQIMQIDKNQKAMNVYKQLQESQGKNQEAMMAQRKEGGKLAA